MIFNLSSAVHWIDSKDLSVTQSCAGSYVLGPRNRPFYVEQKGFIHLFGVRFRHGGLASFTAMPMSLLMNEQVPLNQLFGPDADALTEQLFETDNEQAGVTKIESFLNKRLQADLNTRQTLQLISLVKRNGSLLSGENLSEATGVHYKKLERIFSRYTGYNPKNFSRVIRFYKTLQQMTKSPSSLTSIGLDSGYYDQPHFIRDFKAFTGKSPSQFHTETPAIANLLLQSRHV